MSERFWFPPPHHKEDLGFSVVVTVGRAAAEQVTLRLNTAFYGGVPLSQAPVESTVGSGKQIVYVSRGPVSLTVVSRLLCSFIS